MRNKKEPKSILEVRAWKNAVAKETRRLSGGALIAYYNSAVKSKASKAA